MQFRGHTLLQDTRNILYGVYMPGLEFPYCVSPVSVWRGIKARFSSGT